MADDAEREQKIMQLMDITGYQYEAAKNMLEIYNGNLEVTSNYRRAPLKGLCRQIITIKNTRKTNHGSVQMPSQVENI